MTQLVRNLIESSPKPNFAPQVSYWVEPGSGTRKSRCGRLRYFAHESGDKWHAEGGYYRCRNIDCPECWNKKGGWLDEAERRIFAGIGKGRPEGWENELQEVVVQSPFGKGSEDWILDAGERRRIVGEFREAAGGRIVPPGAWVLHYKAAVGPFALDYCPSGPHLHIFTVGTLPPEIGLGLLVTRVRKPAVTEVLMACVRGYTAGIATAEKPKPKDRPVPMVGWFGRRVVKKAGPAPPKPEPARFCHSCNHEVPKHAWERVEILKEGISGEGSWVLERSEVRVLPPEFMSRGSLEEESFNLKPRFYGSRKP